MLMTNDNIRLYPHDHFFAKTIIRLIPKEVHPNHVTILRFLLIPPVLYYLALEAWSPALGFFLFAAFTDALDGSLARVRKQITMWGTVADPIADKLLIGTTVVLFVAKEIHPLFAAVVILIELMIGAGAYYRKTKGRYVAANEYGKIKMFLQVLGVSLLILAKLIGLPLAVQFGVGTLSLAIVFAIVSLLTYGF
jgi:CDP-diacylglycerol--glycerol-3-phosphate 3-phosphatidyltransferase